jgi:hypothetical protein
MWWIPLAAGAGLGLVKGIMNQQQEDKDRKIAAQMWRSSPFTGVQPGQVKRSNMIGDVASGASLGATLVPESTWEKLFS